MTKETSHRHAADWIILTIACIAQFMVVLDVSIVNVALPKMGLDLHFTQSSAQWVVNAYVLTFAGFLLLGGRAADFFGRRNVYLVGVAIFTLASVGAGFAHTGTQMIAVRALQGLGGAILSPATLTIIVTTFQGPRLAKAIGAWSAVAGAGGAVGALAGGLLTGWASWRWVFFINLPFGILAGAAALAYLQELRNKNATQKLDVFGSVLVTGGLAALIYGIVNTTTPGNSWTSQATLGWVIGGLALLIVFLFWESKVASHPLVPFRIFKSRSLSTANLIMLLVGAAFFAMWYFLTYYFQEILHFSVVRTGVAFVPMAVSIILGAQTSSRLLGKTGARPILLVGGSLATLGFFWLTRIEPSSHFFPAVIVPATLCALAVGLLFAPLATAATSGVDRADAGLASGVLNTSRQVGGSIGLAALGTVATDRSNAALHMVTKAQAYVDGYHSAFFVSALIGVVVTGIAFTLPATTGKNQRH
jgi:EmrB/QacA subfamily drug resistance transporter